MQRHQRRHGRSAQVLHFSVNQTLCRGLVSAVTVPLLHRKRTQDAVKFPTLLGDARCPLLPR